MAFSGSLLPSVLNMIWCVRDMGTVHTQAGESDLFTKEARVVLGPPCALSSRNKIGG